MPPLVAFENVTRIFREPGGQDVPVLDGVSFEVDRGDSVGLWGLRRSGKSTVLRLAAGLEQPDGGIVYFDGQDISALSQKAIARLVRTSIGFAPAAWNPSRSQRVVDFVSLPLLSDGVSLRDANVSARQILDRVGATSRADAPVSELSPGERTKVSIARALVRQPLLLLVDDPSFTPSPNERDELYALLRSLAHDPALTVIVTSEDLAAIRTARRVMTISDGQVRSSSRPSGQILQFPDDRAQRSSNA